MKGTIKVINREKGFGFIKGTDGVERFFHRSAVARDVGFESLSEGETVSFEHEDGTKGPRATDVERG